MNWIELAAAVWKVWGPDLINVGDAAKGIAQDELAAFAKRAERIIAAYLAGQMTAEDMHDAIAEEVRHSKGVLALVVEIGEIVADNLAAKQTSVLLAVLGSLPKAVGL